MESSTCLFYVVALKDGKVAAAGKPQDVAATGVLGDEVILSSSNDEDTLTTTTMRTDTTAATAYTRSSGKKRRNTGLKGKNNTTLGTGNGGKLIKEETRTEGGVSCQASSPPSDEPNNSVDGLMASSLVNVFQQGEYNGITLTYGCALVVRLKVLFSGYIYFRIGIFGVVMTTLRSFILFTGSLRASRHIQAQLLDAILRAKVRFFDTAPMSRIINRFSTEMETIDQALAPSMSSLLYSCVAASCVVVLISTIIPIFLIPGAFIAGLFWYIGMYYLSTSGDMKRLSSVSRSPIYIQSQETVSGVATICAFGFQRRFIKENYDMIDNNNRPFIWMWGANRWLHCRIDILGTFVGSVTGIGLLVSRSSIDAGLADLALSYSLTITRYILWVVRQYAMYEMNRNSVERVQEYLDVEQEPSALIEATRPQNPSWPENGSVKVYQLEIKYSPENPPVLHGISFETRPREKVDSWRPAAGLFDLRSRLTIIPQDPVLFSGTLRSNLDPFHEFTDADLYAALKRPHLVHDGNYEQVSPDSPVAKQRPQLVQEQRQLIALARALVKKSSLIVLDEATSSVDFVTDHKIQQTIRSEFTGSWFWTRAEWWSLIRRTH
ncbi:ABC transporter type 1, transmembrane domain-containing protein [Zychaea mexicana]|uniref:ABC transporter type 1, transmembrane domain-containing protein n=1 Tax=Zychaea mexicana TaxID=64656 RepID=UPI0022FDCDCA|nr:ABC transporter type 1, transmembrane domain-containing protein [Zychaea mexicana]KAI9497160.1 ABC transporter type 1, transmembrane domain-containing protein [Zychaea mexicana]